MKHGQRNAGRIRGAIPPPRYTPPADALVRLIGALEGNDIGGLLAVPVADTLKRSQTYADAPYAETKHSSERMHDGQPASSAAREIAAGRSCEGGIGVSVPH